jgi:hypothetical protein
VGHNGRGRLAMRLAYTLIFMIPADMDFNAIKGNPTAYLVMTMLAEVAIIATCTYIIQAKIPLSHDHNRSHQKLGTEDGGWQLLVRYGGESTWHCIAPFSPPFGLVDRLNARPLNVQKILLLAMWLFHRYWNS